MKKTWLTTLLFCMWTFLIWAQQAPQSVSQIKAKLQKLDVLGSVLYLAAHPDDENTRLIAWLAQEKKYRTGYLSLTRGDGGQNLIGTELAEELGLIRTQELLAARAVDGGEQFFSSANDFGFSKSPEETLEFWEKEKILADAVWVIRQFKPDVIIARFPPDPRAGHGHHQASAMLAIEAFSAAADPHRFKEQLAHTEVWQAKRLLWNTANFGGNNNTSPDQFNIEVGHYNPLTGQSYGEVSAESRSNHKSQGFGAARQRGATKEFFQLLEGSAPKETLMDDVQTTWDRVNAPNISQQLQQISQRFEMDAPEKSIPSLIKVYQEIQLLKDPYWKSIKSKEITELILSCAGVWVESYAPHAKVGQMDTFQIRTDYLVRRPNVQIEIDQIQSQGQTTLPIQKALPYNQLQSVSMDYTAKDLTQPYWLKYPGSRGSFVVQGYEDLGKAQSEALPTVEIKFNVNGTSLQVDRPIQYKYTDPVRGEVHEPLSIAPAVTVNFEQKALLFIGNQPNQLDVTFTGHKMDGTQRTIKPVIPNGWTIEPSMVELNFEYAGEEIAHVFTITPTQGVSVNDSLSFEITQGGRTEKAHMIRVIDYEHIPKITWFPPSSLRLSKIDTKTSAQRIGYIAGAGDKVAESLRAIGLQVDLLLEEDILKKDLSVYDAIVAGIRAYNVLPRVRHMHPKLMEYVASGGTYVVQYNVSGGLSWPGLGPYALSLSRNRVTDETAPVRFLLPDHELLNYPNKLSAADFDTWVQERGLYFVGESDKRYQRPLGMNDPGESMLDGSILFAKHGKGNFVYTSLAFFRQLPAGVPGAYRLFVNLLAKPNNEDGKATY
jgi:LmbE family N-acetylglucosaminyl deacetylase